MHRGVVTLAGRVRKGGGGAHCCQSTGRLAPDPNPHGNSICSVTCVQERRACNSCIEREAKPFVLQN